MRNFVTNFRKNPGISKQIVGKDNVAACVMLQCPNFLNDRHIYQVKHYSLLMPHYHNAD